jgi:hypothetical protein
LSNSITKSITKLPNYSITKFIARFLLASALCCAAACDRQAATPQPTSREVVIWNPIGKWSGSGNMQTSSFQSATGSFRVQWETRNERPIDRNQTGGRFRLTLHSAISGRPLVEVIDKQGVGSDLEYVHEDPRVFYMVVDSSNVDWSFSVEERMVGSVTDSLPAREH